jgi:hypothetical protein
MAVATHPDLSHEHLKNVVAGGFDVGEVGDEGRIRSNRHDRNCDSLYPVMGSSDICCAVGFPMWRDPSGQKELKSSAMIALLDAASWFFQASHCASRGEIASVNSGIETLCHLHVSSFRSQFLGRHDAAKYRNRSR